MKRMIPILCAGALLAACGDTGRQQQANQEPYSAPSSPDASGQAGYATDPGFTNQQGPTADGGRGSAATGASAPGQNLGTLPTGDTSASSQQRPMEQTP